MQDTIVDKLIPTVLRGAGEPVAAAIDNLDRLERLGLIASADQWLEMRGLRNRLVHEYFDRPEDLAPALERTCRLTDLIHRDYVQSANMPPVTWASISETNGGMRSSPEMTDRMAPFL